MRKSFSSNKLTPITLPKQPTSDAFIDISILDVMGIEEFLSVIKYRTENNQKDTWKEIYSLISHLKASRELMFIETQLFSSKSQEDNNAESLKKIVDRLVDATRVIFDVERVNILEIDTETDEFVLTSSSEKQGMGIRFAIKDGIESELLSKCSIINAAATSVDQKYLNLMDSQGKKSFKNILCVPIIVESTIIGVLEAINKPILIMNTPRDINTPKGAFFSASEEKCLSFISSIVGSVLLRQIKSPLTQMKTMRLQNGTASSSSSVRSATKKSTFNIHNRTTESASKRSTSSDLSMPLQSLLDVTYQKLDAERVSIFAYDAYYQKLVCAVSLDIKGLRLPLDTGYVGQCYSTSRVINITDALHDPIHYKDIDKKVGFTSRSVLSVPILGADGVATGVVQAINKKNAVKFSNDDEMTLLELGKHFFNLLNNGNSAINTAENSVIEGGGSIAPASINTVAIASSAAATISRYIVDMLKCKSVNELFARAEHSVKSFVSSAECDMVAIYFCEKDMLVRAVVSDHLRSPMNAGKQQAYGFKGSMKMSELPLEIKEALQQNRTTEFNAHNSTELNNLLPDVSIFQALIVPINSMFRGSAGSCVIIYAKVASAGCVPFTSTTKDLLSSFSECFSCALQENVERTAVEDNLKTLQTNLFKISNTLTNLQEVIIVLNREGNVIMCNKNLDDFFGHQSNANSKAIGFQSLSEEGHYSLWLTAEQCPQLYKDVGTTLQNGRLINREDVLISNPHKPEGLFVDYRIVAIDKSETESPSKLNLSSILITIRKSKVDHKSDLKPHNTLTKNTPGILVNPSIPIPSDLFQWDFNVLKYTEKPVLCNLMGKLFETLLSLSEIGINYTFLSNFIVEVGDTYNDLPFHNLQHSANVTHFTFMLIKATNALANLKPHMVFAILLSAMVHDIDHPGNTNLFEINSQSELALLYNDQAVLENHHCSVAFRLMRKENMQILSTMTKPHAAEVRKFVIGCILATDMTVHFDLVEEIKNKQQAGGWNFSDGKDQLSLGKILVHAADLSNPVRPFHMSVAWARRISTEFNEQVEREQSLGLPVLAFMITKDDAAFCKNEIGFSSFVVAPMWRAIHHVFPDLRFLVDQMESNAIEWKEWAERLKEEEKDGTI
mmetsp:Transcript_2306/g.3159  ORF Transcript_2306/g.3159 Transcript_2306/m.3159 type:complete len:1128 (-) Transcript_2306:365-3748(-)|eukprot:CAMPEP_0170073232 /NCGR_PEP_ID=MMETSP0019_2-20121128/10681_1 /TAXON_ID=98059 /ORGANISM="Dinobryon sp., Strain UTEXLB2267" /LENGTH=1127 /DNA_ID=CAMNT_0010282619 /DNA_START=138 /DNA_END=3521 /DNA_ORIENTATION=-